MEDTDVKNVDIKSKLTFIPEKLKSGLKGNVIQAINTLLHKLNLSLHNGENLSTFERTLKVLLRGIASNNTIVERNYFLALHIIFSTFKTSSWFSLKYILSIVKSELQISANTTKGDEGELLSGRVLLFGVLVRSGVMASSPLEDQVTVLTNLFQDIKGKSYLPLIADPFIKQYLQEIDKSVMKKAVWPVLQKEISPGPNQSLIVYHMLLLAEEKFPSVVNAKYIQQTMGAPQILSPSTMPGLLSALQKDLKLKSLKHPIYQDIFKHLPRGSEDALQCFWKEVNEKLLVDSSSPSNKNILAVKFFSLIVSNLETASQVTDLLTPNLVTWLTRKLKTNGNECLHSEFVTEACENLCKLCSKPESAKSVSCVLKKLMFKSGNVLSQQNSGSKLLSKLSAYLTEKGVIKLVDKLKSVISNKSNCVECTTPPSTRPWHNTERLHATYFFCNLLGLPAVQANTTWRLEQLIFLFDMGFFPTTNVGVELAGLIRESFYGCLNHKVPSLVDFRNLLAGIAKHIDTRINKGDELRIELSKEVLPTWSRMYATAEGIDNNNQLDINNEHRPWVTSVFKTMFYHIGLHLFKEAAFATDVLQELHSVYERVSEANSTSGREEDEPHWTEVVIEMVLSLLSRNSQLHRHVIGCIFSNFCPLMGAQNIHQILQVLDPRNNANPLLNTLDSDTETSSEEENMNTASDQEQGEEESSDDGMSDDADDVVDEKANDKLRRAVFEALGDNGALTDVESVDIDEMDEDESARVDKALSEAFRANRQAKNKKGSSHAKALMTFRIRVLDLVEVWANSEPQLDLLLDTMLTLMVLLEHSLVDKHQAALESRVRSVIMKIATTKKYSVSECKTIIPLGSILKNLLEKGDRSTIVFMSIVTELTACASFIVKASPLVTDAANQENLDRATVFKVLKDTVSSFFNKRDCLLPAKFYERLFHLNVPFIVKLASKLPDYAFDVNVHPFRRSMALEFVLLFWKTNRIMHEPKENQLDVLMKMAKHIYKGSVKMLEEPLKKVQPKFIGLLNKVFDFISANDWITGVNWQDHFMKLHNLQKTKKETKSKLPNRESVNVNDDEAESEDKEDNLLAEGNKIQAKTTVPTNQIANGKLVKVESSGEKCLEQNKQKDEQRIGKLEKVKKKTPKRKVGECSNSESDNGDLKNNLHEAEINGSPDDKSKHERKRINKNKKRVQLLKSNSKKLRLAAMAEGLDNNLISKYKLLERNNVHGDQ